MKVLFANDDLNRGGTETLICDTFKYAQSYREPELGSLDLLLQRGNGGYAPELVSAHANVFVIPRGNLFDLGFLMRVRRLLKERKYDIVHSHSTTLGIYLWLAKIGLRVKLVQTIHGFWDRRCPEGKLKLKVYLTTVVMSYLADATLCVSEYLKLEATKSLLRKTLLFVVYNGVDFEKFRQAPTRYTSNLSTPIFGMVGSLSNVRDHECLMRAFETVLHSYPQAKLKFAGDGVLRSHLEKLVRELKMENSVEFLGTVSDVAGFLVSIDCFVYSSNSDTFGIAVIEAMGAGVPVIVSDNGPFPELTMNGKYGRLFRAHDPSHLAKEMQEFIHDPTSFQSQASEAQVYSQRTFSIESHVEALLAVYSVI